METFQLLEYNECINDNNIIYDHLFYKEYNELIIKLDEEFYNIYSHCQYCNKFITNKNLIKHKNSKTHIYKKIQMKKKY